MLSRSFVMCAILGFLASAVPSVEAQETLAWKFQSGESLKYEVTQNTDMQSDVAGQTQTMETNNKMDMVWKVGAVAANGTAVMIQVVERVQMTSKGGPFGDLHFDSNDGKTPESPLVKSMVEVFRKIIGQEFSVTMRPTGKIDNVIVPQTLLKDLTKSGAVGSAMTEDVLKQMMTQSAVTLPESSIEPGDTWQSSQKVDLPVGTMTVNSKLTYKGNDKASEMALIEIRPSISMMPKDGAPITLTVNKSEGQGIVQFDRANGRIAKSDLDLTLDMEIKQFGQIIRQTLRQTTSMVLVAP